MRNHRRSKAGPGRDRRVCPAFAVADPRAVRSFVEPGGGHGGRRLARLLQAVTCSQRSRNRSGAVAAGRRVSAAGRPTHRPAHAFIRLPSKAAGTPGESIQSENHRCTGLIKFGAGGSDPTRPVDIYDRLYFQRARRPAGTWSCAADPGAHHGTLGSSRWRATSE